MLSSILRAPACISYFPPIRRPDSPHSRLFANSIICSYRKNVIVGKQPRSKLESWEEEMDATMQLIKREQEDATIPEKILYVVFGIAGAVVVVLIAYHIYWTWRKRFGPLPQKQRSTQDWPRERPGTSSV